MPSRELYKFMDIHEIWDAIKEEYRAFPDKYRQEQGKRGIIKE